MLTINGGNVDGTVSGAGNYYAMDGNSAVPTVNAGNGDDCFQIGQLYASRPSRRATRSPAMSAGFPAMGSPPR